MQDFKLLAQVTYKSHHISYFLNEPLYSKQIGHLNIIKIFDKDGTRKHKIELLNEHLYDYGENNFKPVWVCMKKWLPPKPNWLGHP